MRTTVHINDDAYAIVMQYAKARQIGVGKAISELVVKGARKRLPVKELDGLFVFDLPDDSPTVTTEQIKALEEEW
ncbi:MAG: antitoxin [Candidatus Solibacter usitatus]|nr:antitoxin [Candidatus Solibacter usitatus]